MDQLRRAIQRRLSYDAGDQRHAAYPSGVYQDDLLFASIVDWLNTMEASSDMLRRCMVRFKGASMREYVKDRKADPVQFFGGEDEELEDVS